MLGNFSFDAMYSEFHLTECWTFSYFYKYRGLNVVLRCSWVIWKQFVPFEACFELSLGRTPKAFSEGLILPHDWNNTILCIVYLS